MANPPQEEKFPVSVALFSSVLEDNDNDNDDSNAHIYSQKRNTTIISEFEEESDDDEKHNPSTAKPLTSSSHKKEETSAHQITFEGKTSASTQSYLKNDCEEADEECVDGDNEIETQPHTSSYIDI